MNRFIAGDSKMSELIKYLVYFQTIITENPLKNINSKQKLINVFVI